MYRHTANDKIKTEEFMRKKLSAFFVFVVLILAIAMLAACNGGDSTEQQAPSGTENPGTENPGADETTSFTVTFDTQGGSSLPSVTVESGSTIGEITPPTKQCSVLIGFATDASGERMWDLDADKVSANMTLYAIWEDSHTWNDWTETAAPTCAGTGEATRACRVCGQTEVKAVPALGHDFENGVWQYNDGEHWKVCDRCGATSAHAQHSYNTNGVCECGHKEATPASMFEFASVGSGKWEVTAYTGTRKEVTVPSEYNGGNVVGIGDRAFYDNEYVTRLTIPEGVKYIGERAFYSCPITNISLPNSLTFIGKDAFAGFVNSYKFEGNELDGGLYIGNKTNPYLALVGTTDREMTDLVLADGTKFICSAFVGVETDHLVRLTLSDELLYLEDFTFSNLVNNNGFEYNTYGNANYIGSKSNPYMVLMSSVNDAITDCTIHEDTLFIDNNAFEECRNLVSLSVPAGVKSIGRAAFAFCTSLESLTLPDGITKLPADFAKWCKSLRSVTIPSSVSEIGDAAFAYCDSLTSITFKGTTEEWNAVTKDNDWAFNSNSLKSVICTNGTITL